MIYNYKIAKNLNIKMDGQNRRPCRYGNNCNKYQQGTCTFSHDYNPNMGGGGGRPKQTNYPPSNYPTSGGRGGYTNPYNTGNNNGPNYPNNNLPDQYLGGNLGGRGGRGGGGGGRGGNYPPTQQQNEFNNNDISFQFCRFFQTSQCTKPGCKKAHEFTKDTKLKRIYHIKQVPTAPKAKLGMLEANGAKVFTLKIGNVVTLFQYNPQNENPITELNQNFVLEYPEIHYYMPKQKYIYFAYESKTTGFSNIGYIDVMTQQRITVEGAHKRAVTGIVHINDINNQPIVLSSSIQGSIKAWKIEGDKLVLNTEITQVFHKFLESERDFQVLFLKKDSVQGNQVLAAGTSDNRLFLWIGNQLSLSKVSFPNPYNNVLSIKYVQMESVWIAMLIIFNEPKNMSSIMALNLSNMQFQSVIEESQVSNPKLLFHSVDAVGELLFVSNWQGMISIYKVPNFKQKIGCIMHNNQIAEMISFKQVTSTGIQMLNLMVLEEIGQKQQQTQPGSLSVYTLR